MHVQLGTYYTHAWRIKLFPNINVVSTKQIVGSGQYEILAPTVCEIRPVYRTMTEVASV